MSFSDDDARWRDRKLAGAKERDETNTSSGGLRISATVGECKRQYFNNNQQLAIETAVEQDKQDTTQVSAFVMRAFPCPFALFSWHLPPAAMI